MDVKESSSLQHNIHYDASGYWAPSDLSPCQEQSAARGQWDVHGLSLKHSLVERSRENSVLHKFST
jgi:hypothetical protein